MNDAYYNIVKVQDITDALLTPKTFGISSRWKYSNLWYRTFHYKDYEFSILAEQNDIGDCFVHGKSDILTALLSQKGVKGPKHFHITKVEGDPDNGGQIFHLEEKFTLEVIKWDEAYRYQVYPAEYNDMVQKRCLMRASFPVPPIDVIKQTVNMVYEGTKEDIPEAYRHLLKPKKQSLGCLPFVLALLALSSFVIDRLT